MSYQFMDSFHPVKSGKISELISRQIKGAILDGALTQGDRLPSERELVEKFQASRISVREALKSLEISGLLTIRPGAGVFVAEVSSKTVTESLFNVLRMKNASLNDLTEARVILEPSIARLACKKMSSEHLLKLEENIEEALALVRSHFSARLKNIEFHSIFVESTGNSALTVTMKTLLDIQSQMSSEILDHSPKNIEVSRRAISDHRKIAKAFREKDPEKVHDLMLEHVLQIQKGLKGEVWKKAR